MYALTLSKSGSVRETIGPRQDGLLMQVYRYCFIAGFAWLLIVPEAVSSPTDSPLNEASITRLDGVVEIFEDTTGKPQTAQVGEVIKDKGLLKTGDASQAELEFKDTTLTRIGSHTIFTFDQTVRKLKLEEGSMLLQVFKAEGACRIITPAISAAALEATVIVEVRDSGDTSLFLLQAGEEKRME